MKIKIFSVIIAFLLSKGAISQEYRGYQIKEPVGISSVNEAADIAREILKAAGLKANFMIAEANVPNAEAVFYRGQRYVLYNPGFINKLTQATGTKWAAISVLAHEIGHHLYFSLIGEPGVGLATESEADKFSGYVLENMGATLEEAEAAMNLLATPYATATHPAKDVRINSIASGWQLAGGIAPVKKTENTSLSKTEPFLARIRFTNAINKDYYITEKLNLIKMENGETVVLGQVRKTDDRSYPFIISDSQGYKLYISDEGEIVNGGGRVVGHLTKA